MLRRILGSKRFARIVERVQAGGVVKLSGVWGSSAPLLGAAIGAAKNALVLFVCPHLDDADAIADDVEVLTGLSADLFPAVELEVPYGDGDELAVPADHVSDEILGQRLRICRLLAEPGRQGIQAATKEHMAAQNAAMPPKNMAAQNAAMPPKNMAANDAAMPPPIGVIVAPVAALLQPVPTPQALAEARLGLAKGVELGPDKLAQWLVDAGFERVESVEQQGEFAGRGGIVDVFAPGENQPLRVEFVGDAVESLRNFDLDTQRSTAEVGACDVVSIAAARLSSPKSGRRTDPAQTTHLLDYLPANAIIVTVEPLEVISTADAFQRRLGDSLGGCSPEAVFKAARRFAVVDVSAFGPSGDEDAAEPVFELGIRSVQRLEMNTAEALDELEDLCRENETWVYCENPAERDRFLELLSSAHQSLRAQVKTEIGHVRGGFYWPGEHLAVAAHHEIFHRQVLPRRLRRVRAGRPIDSFVDLQDGDYVVHLTHGIARFEGLRTIEKDRRKEEYLTLRFADKALLHVPVTQIQLVQKYIGARRGHPTLSHLGGSAWASRKKRVAEAVHDLAEALLRVQAIRASARGASYAKASDWEQKFEQEFPYEETEDQLSAMQQIYADLAEFRPMDRLLCGDVGYGKTELAMRAAFRVAESGKQVAVLVPTTVLAAQHYRTFTERFADYPFAIDVLSRFRSGSEQAKILHRAATGKLDILIGTHRLLSEDVVFADLGLVVIDEEQRFGVEHKERLKQMRTTVEVLTLTATPIPRTLHMALLGLRDISNLTTAPLDRRAIYTEVCQPSDQKIRAAILRELARGGQVFFVHNRVYSIETVADHLRALVPEARIDVGHGQMSERGLERTMLRFVRGEIDVLVCTTIIESGLDIPTANTMFVHDADRFGLAELHQLRGRIGRYKYRAYCYLLLPRHRSVNAVAGKRLKAVEEFSDLGAGFQIAMRDLEIRGAGNILGPEQSGHIAAVGYELYCRLLEQSVKQLRGEPVAPQRDVHVELAVDAYIPRAYIASSRQRMEVYRRLALCQHRQELAQLARDLADAYGPVPPAVEALLTVAEIRVLAGALGLDRIILMPPDVVFTLGRAPFDGLRAAPSSSMGGPEPVEGPGVAGRALKGLSGSVRMADERTAHWRPPPALLQPPALLEALRRQLRKAAQKLQSPPRHLEAKHVHSDSGPGGRV